MAFAATPNQPLFRSGMFTIDPNSTPDQIATKRALMAALMPRFGSAKYVGEGLGQLATGVAMGLQGRKLDKIEGKGRQEATEGFDRLFGGPMSILGVNPDYGHEQPMQGAPSAPADRNSPYQIGQDARSALGLPAGEVDFAALEQQYGLPAGYLDQTYQIESGGNPNAQNPNSSAGGGFQFIDSTAKAYGLTDKTDLGASADAAARLAADNKAQLMRALGREPTAGELYLSHQQGGGGASALLANPNARAVDVVGAEAVRLNGGDADMTAGEFAGKWTGKFGGNPAANTALPGVEADQIMAMLANPWLSPEQRQMLTTMMESQIQAGDPIQQMQVEKARLELDQLRNPQVDPMAAIELQQAQLNLDQDRNPQPEAGYQQLTPQEVTQMGLPPGVYQRGPDGRIDTVEKTQGIEGGERYQAVGGQIWDMKPEHGGPPTLVGGGSEEIIYGPDGQPIVTRGPAGTSKPFTESQSKDVVFSTRAKGALTALDPIADTLTDRSDVAAGWLPFGLGGGVQSSDYQVAKTAGDEFLQAILRKDTGAAITQQEQQIYGETYLPKPGDSSKRLEYKKQARQRAVTAIDAGMSPAQIIAQERALESGGTKIPPTQIDGYTIEAQ